MMKVHVGTSGYSYKEWKGSFYPEDLAADGMLEYYASRFTTVEINNTFYRMPKTSVVEGWRDTVPASFQFVIKASRRITHMKRIKNVEEEVAYFLEVTSALGDKQGPMLFQLPPNLKKDLERLDAFLALLPSDRRSVMEFRHDSWLDDEVFDRLRGAGVALCHTDAGKVKKKGDDEAEAEAAVADGEPTPIVATAGFGYFRLRDDLYDDAGLDAWAARVLEQPFEETYVFFKHEDEGKGPDFAARFRGRLEAGGAAASG